jgi:hypothetical protein
VYAGPLLSQFILSASSPLLQHDAAATQKPALARPDPTQYTLDDGPRDEPGTAAYYKSWAFRQKVNKGKNLVPKQEGEVGEDVNDSADEDYIKEPKHADKRSSLVMIFGTTNVRRAITQRKVNARMQSSNRRT